MAASTATATNADATFLLTGTVVETSSTRQEQEEIAAALLKHLSLSLARQLLENDGELCLRISLTRTAGRRSAAHIYKLQIVSAAGTAPAA